MTEFDKKLIEKADTISRWHYRDMDVLISIADTDEAKNRLAELKWELYDCMRESL